MRMRIDTPELKAWLGKHDECIVVDTETESKRNLLQNDETTTQTTAASITSFPGHDLYERWVHSICINGELYWNIHKFASPNVYKLAS